MNTLKQFGTRATPVPATAVWYLTDLAESRGRQDLFTRQAPRRLKALREHALVESAVSSNRIEGVQIDASRVATVVFGRQLPRNRDEEEVRGYRDALALIHEQGAKLPVTEATVLRLHGMTRGETWDAGRYKERDGDIIEKYPDGRERVRFRTVPAAATPAAMAELTALWGECLRERWTHPLVALAAFNLDFLCVHPFRDGNGRVSRLLLLLQCYHLGFEVGRCISLSNEPRSSAPAAPASVQPRRSLDLPLMVPSIPDIPDAIHKSAHVAGARARRYPQAVPRPGRNQPPPLPCLAWTTARPSGPRAGPSRPSRPGDHARGRGPGAGVAQVRGATTA